MGRGGVSTFWTPQLLASGHSMLCNITLNPYKGRRKERLILLYIHEVTLCCPFIYPMTSNFQCNSLFCENPTLSFLLLSVEKPQKHQHFGWERDSGQFGLHSHYAAVTILEGWTPHYCGRNHGKSHFHLGKLSVLQVSLKAASQFHFQRRFDLQHMISKRFNVLDLCYFSNKDLRDLCGIHRERQIC